MDAKLFQEPAVGLTQVYMPFLPTLSNPSHRETFFFKSVVNFIADFKRRL